MGMIPLGRLMPAVIVMGLVILASNILVEMPVQMRVGSFDMSAWVTYGAITYPMAFLVTDTTNRLYGARAASLVVLAGFATGVVLSLVFADIRIAIASGTAFAIAQMLDVYVFDRLRRAVWWQAPVASSLLGSAVDTALFFSIAFAGTGLAWQTWAIGDFMIKLMMAALLLPVFRGLMSLWPSQENRNEAVV
jgi:uncharacterized PurR-regulated membrane protein YhhQ (DUF165 family)